jgi:glycerophosphoryl diester phosphodiesterase
VEFKEGAQLPARAIRIIREAGAAERVLLASFEPMLMSQARRLAPEMAACYDWRNGLQMLRQLRQGPWERYVPQAEVLSLDPRMLEYFNISAEEARAVREKGILLQVHTINDPEAMRHWLTFGVESIITDYPDRLEAVISGWQPGAR